MQLYLQLQHLHYYYTNIYTYNMLANYTTHIYTTYYMHYFAIRDLKKKKNDLKKYETIYNTILMLLRTILILQYNCLQIDVIND